MTYEYSTQTEFTIHLEVLEYNKNHFTEQSSFFLLELWKK